MMSCRLVSSGGNSGLYLCSKSYQETKLSSSHGGCSRLFFGSKLSKPSRLSVKTAPRGSSGAMAMAGASAAIAQTTVETFYDMLGIPESGTLLEIKKAYKQLARKYHPDVSPPDRIGEHTKRFIMLKEAYDTLSDPLSRAIYDQDLAGSLRLQRLDDVGEWKSRWQSQISELKRRSMIKNHRGKASWGARMRRQTTR